MNTLFLRIIPFFLFVFAANQINAQDDFLEILKKADFYRGGTIEGVSWDLVVENIEKGKQINELGIRVEASTKEDDQYALVTFLKPKKYDGQKLLLRGNNMWFVKKGLRSPVPISGRQRLSGSAANADVASANYCLEYDIEATTSETLDGVDCWLYELKAKNNLVSYSSIKYWIEKEKNLGLKAEFYGKSGKLIKTGLFEYDQEISYNDEMHTFISKVTILDNINAEDKTILQLSSPEVESFKNSKFQKNSLIE